MNCYLVERTDNVRYIEDYAMVIIANSEQQAEKIAIKESDDFMKCNIKVTRINMNKEQTILIANYGA